MKARLLILTIFTAICTVCSAQNTGKTDSGDSMIIIRRDTTLVIRCDTVVTQVCDTITESQLANLLVQGKFGKRYVLDDNLKALILKNTVEGDIDNTPVLKPKTGTASKSYETLNYETVPTKTKPEKNKSPMDRGLQDNTFIRKGTWFGGVTVSYNELNLDNINSLLIKDISAKGYSFGVSPFVGFFPKKDLAFGIRGNYNRSMADLGTLNLNLGDDFKINLKDMYYLKHDIQAAAFMRNYMSLFGSKMFGFFSEIRLTYGYGQSKVLNGKYENGTLDGTFSQTHSANIGFAPGMSAFLQDWMAAEVQLGVMGFGFKWTDQVTNQVEQGSQTSMTGKFDIDMFSISIGASIYF